MTEEPVVRTTASAGRDPFAPLDASPRGRTALAVAALVAAVAAALTALTAVVGPLGMVFGLLAHVKGSRVGMPATVLAGIGTILGFTIASFLR